MLAASPPTGHGPQDPDFMAPSTIEDLAGRARALRAERGSRVLIGISGVTRVADQSTNVQ